MARTNPSATSASRVHKPIIASAPAIISTKGIVTPATHKDHTGRNVSAKGRKYLRACCSGPSWKTFQTPAMKKIKPSTRRANSSAQARLGFGFLKLVAMISGIAEAGENIFFCEVGKVFEDLFLTHPRGNVFQYIVNRDSHSANAGLAASLARLNRDGALVTHGAASG